MKERPILFSAPMVRALLNCTKSQTRRIVKPSHIKFFEPSMNAALERSPTLATAFCPYGQPGDRLWVREAFGIGYDDGNGGLSAIPWTGSDPQRDGTVVYRADFNEEPDEPRRPWKPSIHMPRWASRILLEITAVRVERLADISKDDAMAEGIVLQPDGGFGLADSTHYNFSDPTDSYCSLWESINGAGSWYANPWVWVVEFKRLKGGA